MISDVDEFCIHLYSYFIMCGWKGIVCREFRIHVRLLSMVILMITIVQLTNWSDVISCVAKDCADVVFSGQRTFWLTPSLIIVFCMITVWQIRTTLDLVYRMRRIKDVYEQMDIEDIELRILPWKTISDRFLHLNAKRRFLIRNPTAEHLTQIIMRRQNYMIALLGAELIPQWMISQLGRYVLECIIVNKIKPTERLVINAAKLAKQSQLVGLIMLLLSPLTFAVLFTYSIVVHATEIKTKTFWTLFERDFTPGAKIKYQQFNELNHDRDLRLEVARAHANLYLQTFPTPIFDAIKDSVNFVANAFMVFVICIVTVNEEMIVHGRVLGVPMFLWVAVTTLLSGATRPKQHVSVSSEELRNALSKLSQQIRYAPISWSVIGTDAMYDIRKIYRMTILIVAQDLAACILVPYFLLVYMPSRSFSICCFLRHHTIFDVNLGNVCSYASTPHETPEELPLTQQNSVTEDSLVNAYLSQNGTVSSSDEDSPPNSPVVASGIHDAKAICEAPESVGGHHASSSTTNGDLLRQPLVSPVDKWS